MKDGIINKLKTIKKNKELLKEGFYSELPKKYINLFARLLISGQKSNNNFGYKTKGLMEFINEKIFPTIREFYVNLQKKQRLNIFLKTNSRHDTLYELNKFFEASDNSQWFGNGVEFIYFHELENPLEYNHIKKQGSRWFSNLDLDDKDDFKLEYDAFDRAQKVNRFIEELSKFGIQSKDLKKMTNSSNLPKKKKANNELSETLESLLKMPNIPVRVILEHDEKTQEINMSAEYDPNYKFIKAINIYVNLHKINANLTTAKNGLNGIFNDLKNKIALEVNTAIHHELIHHIQITSDKKKNASDIEEHYKSVKKNSLKEPHPFEPDYVNKKKEYDEYYKNLKIKDLHQISSNLEIKAYIEQVFSRLKNIKRKFKKGDLTQEEYNKLFTKVNQYYFEMFKKRAYSFAETHFSKKFELMGQKYDHKTAPNKAYLAVLARFFSVLLNDYNKQDYLEELITNISSFDATNQYIIPLAIERAKTEKHTLKR